MKLSTFPVALAAAVAMAVTTSCDETNSIGSSLVQNDNTINVETDFTVTGSTLNNDKIQSRSITQLLGSIDAKGYGAFSSDFVTQFMPAAALDSTLVSAEAIDSVKLLMMYTAGNFVGDSVIPMGLEVYRLNKTLEAPIFSDFNPKDYYDSSNPLASKVYTATNLGLPTDSMKKLSYREIYVDMPLSLGTELYDLYKTDPAAYLDPYLFSNNFKGIYVKNSYGSGRVTKIEQTLIQLYYHYDTKNSSDRDTTYNLVGNFYAVTPEIITNNNIDYTIANDLRQRIDRGENIIIAPAGTEVEINFPLKDIMDRYREKAGQISVINDLSFSIPATKIANTYGIDPPQNLLLILKNKKQEFFEKSMVTDSKTSFYATFNSSTATYDFSSMRQYLIDALAKDEITADDYTFILTPVTVNTETSSSSYYYQGTTYISSIVPYIEQPAMTLLDLENSKIILTFSNQNLKN